MLNSSGGGREKVFDTKELLEKLEKFTFEIYYPTWYDYFSGKQVSPPPQDTIGIDGDIIADTGSR